MARAGYPNVGENTEKSSIDDVWTCRVKIYEEKCKELNLDTLQARRDKQDLQELYKMLTMTGSLDPDTMFKKVEARQGVATRSTRDENRLQAPRTRLETRRNFFTVRVVEKWNALPAELKSAANLHGFKKGLSDLLG